MIFGMLRLDEILCAHKHHILGILRLIRD